MTFCRILYGRELQLTRKFLGAFHEIAKSVCPPVWNNSAPTRRISMKLEHFSSWRHDEKIHV